MTGQQTSETVDCCSLSRNGRDAARENQLRYWQIQDFFKCPVVGMCLTRAEQRRMLKKTGVSAKGRGAFELHELLVSSAETENRLSRRIDALLHRKFGKLATDWVTLDGNTVLKRFKRAHASGDHTGALWATAIHPNLSIEVKREIFGLLHMTMHYSGEERTKMNQLLARRETELEKRRLQTDQAIRQVRDLRKENSRLATSLNKVTAQLARAQKTIAKLENNVASSSDRLHTDKAEQENRELKAALTRLQRRLDKSGRRNTVLEEKNRLYTARLEEQKAGHQRFTKEARALLAEMISLNRCDTSCPAFDLCKKRILIVGGITRMESLYRDLIEGHGGIFDYHDGVMKKGARTLKHRLKRADVVICPVSCNSHAACSVVKNMAKKHNVTVHMLASSSLQAVSRVILGSPGNRFTVN